jgi:hypothetical protein
MTPTGPVLVDWDSVRVDSAALEAARVAYIFGEGEPEPISRILTAYTAAGGDLRWAGPDLFLSVARNQLQGVLERVLVSLGHLPAPRWMDDDIEQTIGDRLHQLPGTLDRLTSLASATSPN